MDLAGIRNRKMFLKEVFCISTYCSTNVVLRLLEIELPKFTFTQKFESFRMRSCARAETENAG